MGIPDIRPPSRASTQEPMANPPDIIPRRTSKEVPLTDNSNSHAPPAYSSNHANGENNKKGRKQGGGEVVEYYNPSHYAGSITDSAYETSSDVEQEKPPKERRKLLKTRRNEDNVDLVNEFKALRKE